MRPLLVVLLAFCAHQYPPHKEWRLPGTDEARKCYRECALNYDTCMNRLVNPQAILARFDLRKECRDGQWTCIGTCPGAYEVLVDEQGQFVTADPGAR